MSTDRGTNTKTIRGANWSVERSCGSENSKNIIIILINASCRLLGTKIWKKINYVLVPWTNQTKYCYLKRVGHFIIYCKYGKVCVPSFYAILKTYLSHLTWKDTGGRSDKRREEIFLFWQISNSLLQGFFTSYVAK